MQTPTKTDNIIEIKKLRTWFPIKRGLLRRTAGYVKAVDGISLDIPRGKTVGLVGESGCGKTTLGKTILGLYEQSEGEITFTSSEGSSENLLELGHRASRELRKKLQIIFQDPYSSLNPRLRVEDIVQEGMLIHGLHSGRRKARVAELLDQVGLPKGAADKYPHEFSGGQRQRIGIARALAVEPEFIVCDEAVSALDVSIQAQIINLLIELQKEFQLTYLFISHDLSVVEHISDKVAVMYLGRIVEEAPKEELYSEPRHPYTQALLSAVPGRKKGDRILLEGDVPSPANPPSGCHFHPRCPQKKDGCGSWQYQPSGSGAHKTFCLLYEGG